MDQETTLGGGDRRMPLTSIRFLNALSDPEDVSRAFERLCRDYWRPIYLYVRAAWRESNEDAKDLTQAFFLFLIDSGALASFERREVGSFRAYLKVLLRRFVLRHQESLRAIKRGGRTRILSLDAGAIARLQADDGQDPEAVFDRAWATEVIEKALDRVRDECRQGGGIGLLRWTLYEAYDLAPADSRLAYRDLAAVHDVKESDVSNHLQWVRRRLRSEVLGELSLTVSSERELEGEWNRVMGE